MNSKEKLVLILLGNFDGIKGWKKSETWLAFVLKARTGGGYDRKTFRVIFRQPHCVKEPMFV